MTGSWTRSEKRGTYREWKRIRSGRGTPVDTLQGGGGDTEKKEKSASASQHSEQHCFLSDAGCIERNDVRSGHLQH